MNYKPIPPMTAERWLSNLLEAAADIADKQHQELRWLAPDAYAWERPEELINVLDDCVFEGFIEEYSPTFSEEQSRTALDWRDELSRYSDATPQWLDPAEVLADPRWESIRHKAAAFVAAFKDRWPEHPPQGDQA
jgi:hypothetical protein